MINKLNIANIESGSSDEDEFEIEIVTNDIIMIVILYFVMFSKIKKRRNARGVSPLAV